MRREDRIEEKRWRRQGRGEYKKKGAKQKQKYGERKGREEK